MEPEQINQLSKVLSDTTKIHHLRITENGESIDYIIKNIEFERPPKLLITKMYGSKDELDIQKYLNYNLIEKLVVVGHLNVTLFEWSNY
jgi:hypothetical protein